MVDASFHFLATATKLNNADKPLGHEVELLASYRLMKDCRLSVGYSYMDGTDTMVLLKKATDKGDLHWAWIMLTVNPKVFSGTW